MNFGWLKRPSAFWLKTPIFSDDASTLVHLYWKNGGLVDSKGNAWTQVGTVPYNAGSGKIPPSAGPFSASNYYKTTAVNDVFDTLTSGFSAYFVFIEGGAVTQRFISAGNGVNGWCTYGSGTGTVATLQWPATVANTANVTLAGVNIVACGRTAADLTHGSIKLNLGNTVTAAITNSQDTTDSTFIGVNVSSGQPMNGKVIEILVETSDYSDATATNLANTVKAKLGITTW